MRAIAEGMRCIRPPSMTRKKRIENGYDPFLFIKFETVVASDEYLTTKSAKKDMGKNKDCSAALIEAQKQQYRTLKVAGKLLKFSVTVNTRCCFSLRGVDAWLPCCDVGNQYN